MFRRLTACCRCGVNEDDLDQPLLTAKTPHILRFGEPLAYAIPTTTGMYQQVTLTDVGESYELPPRGTEVDAEELLRTATTVSIAHTDGYGNVTSEFHALPAAAEQPSGSPEDCETAGGATEEAQANTFTAAAAEPAPTDWQAVIATWVQENLAASAKPGSKK